MNKISRGLSNLISVEGLNKLRIQLANLEEERGQILLRIQAARSQGDLRENSEYHSEVSALKNLEVQTEELQKIISSSEVAKIRSVKDYVDFGCLVTVQNTKDQRESIYKVVGHHESDLSLGHISIQSPLALALMDKKEGELATLIMEKNNKSFLIKQIKYAVEA